MSDGTESIVNAVVISLIPSAQGFLFLSHEGLRYIIVLVRRNDGSAKILE